MNDNRKAWTINEDEAISSIVQEVGFKNWPLVSQIMKSKYQLQGRTGKQCRERWYNHLTPQLNKMPWSSEEEQLLFFCHRKYGNKWIEISKYFEGRTDNSIKNHFYSTIRRSMRRICKILGNKNSTLRLRNIRPSVLSQIFEFSKDKSKKQQKQNFPFQGFQQNEIELEIQACLLEFANTKPSKNVARLQKNKNQLQLLVEKLITLNEQYINSKKQNQKVKSINRGKNTINNQRIISEQSQCQSQNSCYNQKSTEQVFVLNHFQIQIENDCQSEKFQQFYEEQQRLYIENQQKKQNSHSFYFSKQNYSLNSNENYSILQSNNGPDCYNDGQLQIQCSSQLKMCFLTIKKMPIHNIPFLGSFNDQWSMLNEQNLDEESLVSINNREQLNFFAQPLQDMSVDINSYFS